MCKDEIFDEHHICITFLWVLSARSRVSYSRFCFCLSGQPDSSYLSVFCFPLVCPHVHLSLTLVLCKEIFFMHIEKHLMFSWSLYVVLFLFNLFRIGFSLICKIKFINIPFSYFEIVSHYSPGWPTTLLWLQTQPTTWAFCATSQHLFIHLSVILVFVI